MKRLLFLIILLSFSVLAYATVDTLEGEELTSSATIEGVATTDTIEGQVLASGDSPAFYCEFEGTEAGGTYTMNGNDVTQGDNTGTLTNGSTNAKIADPTGYSVAASPGSGGNALYLEDGDDLSFTVSSDDNFFDEAGRAEFYIYIMGSTGDNWTVLGAGDSNDLLRIRIEADNDIKVYFTHQSGAIDVTYTTGTPVPDTTWTLIRIAWSISDECNGVTPGDTDGDCLKVKVGANAWKEDTDITAMAAFNNAPVEVGAGELIATTIGDGYWIDDLKVFTTFDNSWP